MVDCLLEVPSQSGQLGLKILHGVDDPKLDWDQWQKIKEFEEDNNGDYRLLLIAQNLVDDPQTGEQFYIDFSSTTAGILDERRITAITTFTFCHLYRLCKENKRDPHEIFLRIYQHTGGVFEL